jgi:hypothetical protein
MHREMEAKKNPPPPRQLIVTFGPGGMFDDEDSARRFIERQGCGLLVSMTDDDDQSGVN